MTKHEDVVRRALASIPGDTRGDMSDEECRARAALDSLVAERDELLQTVNELEMELRLARINMEL